MSRAERFVAAPRPGAMRWIPRFGVAACLVLLAAGCTGDDGAPAAGPIPTASRTAEPAPTSAATPEPLSAQCAQGGRSVVLDLGPPSGPLPRTAEEAFQRWFAESAPESTMGRALGRFERVGSRRAGSFAARGGQGELSVIVRFARYRDVGWRFSGASWCTIPPRKYDRTPVVEVTCVAPERAVWVTTDREPWDPAPADAGEALRRSLAEYRAVVEDPSLYAEENFGPVPPAGDEAAGPERARFAGYRPDGSIAVILGFGSGARGWQPGELEHCGAA